MDPNHTHFILVDNAHHTFGGEIDFRARFESEIAKFLKMPVVLVVIEGGPNTAKTTLESVEKKIPCIFIEVILNFLQL